MPTWFIVHNEAASQFEAAVGNKMAVLQYRLAEGSITFTHTGVPSQFEGQGLGSELAHAGLEYARSKNLKVVPLCPFVADYIEKHSEFHDLLSPGDRSKLMDG